MDRIETMQIFVRVAELESFSRAAESLSLPKATVSTSVQALEALLETRLLQRTTRRVQMTQDGIAFYERCKDLLVDVEELESMFRNEPAQIRGRIRIDMPSGIAKNYLVPRLPEFLSKYPGIEVELSSTDRRVDLIREGFDCVIRVGPLSDSGLMARSLGQMTLINCASPAYIQKYGQPRKLEDLPNHFLIHYVPTLGAKSDGFEYFDGEKYRSVKMKGAVTVNNSDAYTAAALAGFGIFQVPLSGAKPLIEAGQLVEVLPKLRAEPMPVSLLYPHRRHLAKRVRVFMEWAEAILKDYVK